MLRRSSKSTLLSRLEAAGQLRGLSRAEVLERLGKPQSAKEYSDGTYWALWQDHSDYAALFFDEEGVCLGIMREIVDRGVHDGAVFEEVGQPRRRLLRATAATHPPPAEDPAIAHGANDPIGNASSSGAESCPACGRPVRPDALSCSACGTPLAISQEPPPPAPAPLSGQDELEEHDDAALESCPVCGAPLRPDALSCSECGTALAISADPPAEPISIPIAVDVLTHDEVATRVEADERANAPVLADQLALESTGDEPAAWETCRSCGRRVRPEASTCAGCGNPLHPVEETSVEPFPRDEPETASTISVANAAAAATVAPVDIASGAPTPGWRTRRVLAVAAVVLVLAAGAVGYVVSRHAQNQSGAAPGLLNTPATALCQRLLPLTGAEALSGDTAMTVRSFVPVQPGLPDVATADCRYAGGGGSGTIVTLLVWQNQARSTNIYADLAAGYPSFEHAGAPLAGLAQRAVSLPGAVVVQPDPRAVYELSAAASVVALSSAASRISAGLVGNPVTTTTTTTAPTTTTTVALSAAQNRFLATALHSISFVATDLAALDKAHLDGRATLVGDADAICSSFGSAGPAATQIPRPYSAPGHFGWSGLYTVWVRRIAVLHVPPPRLDVSGAASWVSLAITDLCPAYRVDIPPGFPGGRSATTTTTTTVTTTTIRVATTTTTIRAVTTTTVPVVTTTQSGLGGGGGIG